MYRPEVRLRAVALITHGHSLSSVSRSTGIDRSTLRDWCDHPEKAQHSRASCSRCAGVTSLPQPCEDYAYLLGLCLGDGCISRAGDRNKDVWKLRIFCADAWPGLAGECVRAIRAIRSDNKIFTTQKQGCTEILSTSRHWPCLFPQHGAGKKHLRTIELAPWQRVIVERHPGRFVRGLMHSDGYRGLNRIRHALDGGDHWYEHPQGSPARVTRRPHARLSSAAQPEPRRSLLHVRAHLHVRPRLQRRAPSGRPAFRTSYCYQHPHGRECENNSDGEDFSCAWHEFFTYTEKHSRSRG